ncbi:MAG: glycosyltransferase family 9 protein [Proteobacteria bacterium]|nr:glycosyltransferase family 9 protein [Pseudomonadota bacterium]
MAQKRLLIVHHGALGDVVATFPALISLRQFFGHIDALVPGPIGQLAAKLKIIDNVYGLESAVFATLYSEPVDPKVIRILRSYDSIVLFSRSRQLHQNVKKHIKKNAHLIPPRPDIDQNIPVSRHILANLVGCGLMHNAGVDYNPLLFSRICRDRHAKGADPAKILIHPGSGSIRKNWPLANFINVALILKSDGRKPEFILGPAEHYLSNALRLQDFSNLKIHRKDDLSELTALLQTAGGFIGNDSGVSHLAAFLGLPSVVVFGPSCPDRWRPSGRSVEVVRPDLDCRPCFETNSENCETMECLTQTTPQEVVDAFYRLVI